MLYDVTFCYFVVSKWNWNATMCSIFNVKFMLSCKDSIIHILCTRCSVLIHGVHESCSLVWHSAHMKICSTFRIRSTLNPIVWGLPSFYYLPIPFPSFFVTQVLVSWSLSFCTASMHVSVSALVVVSITMHQSSALFHSLVIIYN